MQGIRNCVSIHAPTRGATNHLQPIIYRHRKFQFTRPQGARRLRIISIINVFSFNSRAHKGRDNASNAGNTEEIGFNSRAHKGRDFLLLYINPCFLAVSIHAPTRGATYFTALIAAPTIVSIHAPTRGATLNEKQTSNDYLCFNSRAHKGRDLTAAFCNYHLYLFQFTRPQGARQWRF